MASNPCTNVFIGKTSTGSFWAEDCDGDLDSFNPEQDRLYFVPAGNPSQKLYPDLIDNISLKRSFFTENSYVQPNGHDRDKSNIQTAAIDLGIYALLPETYKDRADLGQSKSVLMYSDIAQLKTIATATRKKLSAISSDYDSVPTISITTNSEMCLSADAVVLASYQDNIDLFQKMEFSLRLFWQCVDPDSMCIPISV